MAGFYYSLETLEVQGSVNNNNDKVLEGDMSHENTAEMLRHPFLNRLWTLPVKPFIHTTFHCQ